VLSSTSVSAKALLNEKSKSKIATIKKIILLFSNSLSSFPHNPTPSTL